MAAVFINFKDDTQMLEALYISFAILILFIFFQLIFVTVLELCLIQRTKLLVDKEIKLLISDVFPTFNYAFEVDRYLSIRIRPISYDEGKPILRNGFDFYEYMKDHRPDGEDYYKASNPFELDPHEKDFDGDHIRRMKIADMEVARKNRKNNQLKGGKKMKFMEDKSGIELKGVGSKIN